MTKLQNNPLILFQLIGMFLLICFSCNTSYAETANQQATDKSILKLIDVIGIQENFLENIPTLNSEKLYQEKVMPLVAEAELTKQQETQLEELLVKAVKNVINDYKESNIEQVLRDDYLKTYKKYYTQEEIDAQIKFYSSEVGQNILKKEEKVSNELLELVTNDIEKISQQIEDKHVLELSNEVDKILGGAENFKTSQDY